MKFVDKVILIISPEPWEHIFVSKHHYATNLSNLGNKVFFLNPPGKKNTISPTRFAGLFEVSYAGFPKGLRFYPRFLERRIIRSVYCEIEKLCSARFDVVWSFDNSVFYDFSALPSHVIKISHIVDANQDFQSKRAASTADFCLCSTDFIKTNLSRYNKNVFKINHGFQRSSYSAAPNPLAHKSRRNAIYAGNLSIPFIDWILLAEVIERHPEIDFFFIGPDYNAVPRYQSQRQAKNRLRQRSNVYFTGRVASEELQAYYTSADLLLLTYQEKYGSQLANPHKVMEYLGSGKVVVATHTAEYASLDPLVVMSRRNSEWPEIFARVVNTIDTFNSEPLQEKRKAFAAINSYEKQIMRIEEILSSTLKEGNRRSNRPSLWPSDMKWLIVKFLLKLKILHRLDFTFTLKRGRITFKIPLTGGVGPEHFFGEKEGWMQKVLDSLNRVTNPNSVFVDVGANIGQTLIKVKSLERHWEYIGFEPNPNCLQYLYSLINRNAFTNTLLLPFGLSDKGMTSHLNFFKADLVDSTASVVHGFRSRVHASLPVALIEGDRIFKLFTNPLGVIKIDVEGGELEVIRGLRSVIEKDKPFIICEILPVYDTQNPFRYNRQQELEMILKDLNYTTFRIDSDGVLRRCPEIGIHNNIENINYLFCPASACDAIKTNFQIVS